MIYIVRRGWEQSLVPAGKCFRETYEACCYVRKLFFQNQFSCLLCPLKAGIT